MLAKTMIALVQFFFCETMNGDNLYLILKQGSLLPKSFVRHWPVD
jgi:hypothetical protein